MTTPYPALSDLALAREQAAHLTDAAIEAARSAIAGYVACLDAWWGSPQPPEVATGKQQATADRARAEIMYQQAAAWVTAWSDSGQRPDMSSWAASVVALRDLANAYSDLAASMADPAYPHRRWMWAGTV